MKKYLDKKRGIKLCILFLFLFFISIDNVYGDDDVIGTFNQDTDNDPPVFIDWYETDNEITSFQDVYFYAKIYDLDNSSDQLTVYLFYSVNSFTADNQTQSLTFSQNHGNNTYTYGYNMDGQAPNTQWSYYYQVFDGNTTLKKPLYPTYFSITWSAKISGGGMSPEQVKAIPDRAEQIISPVKMVIVIPAVIVLMGLAILGVRKKKQEEEFKRKYVIVQVKKSILTTRRFWVVAISSLLIITVYPTGYSDFSTLSYGEASVQWKQEDIGMVYTEDVLTSIKMRSSESYEYIFLRNGAETRSLKTKAIRRDDIIAEFQFKLEIQFDNDYLSKESLWIRDSFRSFDITMKHVSIFNNDLYFIERYEQPESTSDTYNIFVSESLLKNSLNGGLYVRYSGFYLDGKKEVNIFLTIYYEVYITSIHN